jgi:energy-coupling factor transporter ATP-binding protein EcfA2
LTEPVVEVCGLSYRYPASTSRPVLKGIDLAIEPGESVVIGGASGSGKSTLCRLFNGLIPQFYGGEMEGTVRVGGLDTRQHGVGEILGGVSMVFQNPTVQLFTDSVARELAFGLESLGLPREEIGQRVAESAATVGIGHLWERNPHYLSGGEQQLVAIAAAFALRPKLIVLDEPYASLDPAGVRRVRAALRQIHQGGTAVVVAEHRLQHVVADAGRMVVLDQGEMVLDGPPREVLAKDLAPYGLQIPPVVEVGRALELPQLPLTVPELVASLDGGDLPPGLLPAPPLPPAGGQTLLQARGVAFSFGSTPVLRDLDLGVARGECLALVGANGSGKTTLVRHFNGLHHPDRGQVTVLGLDTRRTKTSRLARHVGLAFQNANDQFFKLRVRDEIEVGARALGRYDEAWVQELVALFQLEPLVGRSPYRLSEGEKKRVGFASALAARPEILVLDEPTTGQDWSFRRALGQLLGDLGKRGQTVVMVTHDLDFAERYACRWALLAEGRIAAEGDPWDVMAEQELLERAGLEPTQAFRIGQALAAQALP